MKLVELVEQESKAEKLRQGPVAFRSLRCLYLPAEWRERTISVSPFILVPSLSGSFDSGLTLAVLFVGR